MNFDGSLSCAKRNRTCGHLLSYLVYKGEISWSYKRIKRCEGFVCLSVFSGGRGGQGGNRRIKLKSECVAGLMATNCIAKNIYRARSANRILNCIAHRLFEPDRTCYMLDTCSKFQITFWTTSKWLFSFHMERSIFSSRTQCKQLSVS